MAELVDAPDLGSGVLGREGSSPFRRTIHNNPGCLKHQPGLFYFWQYAKIRYSLGMAMGRDAEIVDLDKLF